MRLEYSITFDDSLQSGIDAIKYDTKNKKLSLKELIIESLIIPIFILPWIILNIGNMFFLSIIALISFLLTPFILKQYRLNKNLQHFLSEYTKLKPNYDSNRFIEMSNDKLIWMNNSKKFEMDLTLIKNVIETNTYIYVEFYIITGLTIPITVFKDNAEKLTFLTYIRKYISD